MAKHDTALDDLFVALGDTTRRAILDRLARGNATVSELAAPHDMALPSFMAHLNRLEDAGLVTSTKKGRSRVCRLAPTGLAPALDWLSGQRALWTDRLDRFDAYALTLSQEKTNET